MKILKGDFPVKFETIDLDDIPLKIDITINLPEKKPTEATKRPRKSNSVALF